MVGLLVNCYGNRFGQHQTLATSYLFLQLAKDRIIRKTNETHK